MRGTIRTRTKKHLADCILQQTKTACIPNRNLWKYHLVQVHLIYMLLYVCITVRYTTLTVSAGYTVTHTATNIAGNSGAVYLWSHTWAMVVSNIVGSWHVHHFLWEKFAKLVRRGNYPVCYNVVNVRRKARCWPTHVSDLIPVPAFHTIRLECQGWMLWLRKRIESQLEVETNSALIIHAIKFQVKYCKVIQHFDKSNASNSQDWMTSID